MEEGSGPTVSLRSTSAIGETSSYYRAFFGKQPLSRTTLSGFRKAQVSTPMDVD
jgi:hypothetical protein